MSSEELLQYGSHLGADGLTTALSHTFQRNQTLQNQGKIGTPICIWGTHGIGKTMLVQDYARKHQWKLAYCAPAQFEEMGDLHGMPITVDPDPNIIGDEYTVYAAPDWVPRDKGPGILLLDDINRADDRILRGLMQLLQNFEMFSWQLPKEWQIVATANPEGGDYSVTPMDDAFLTRMLHFTMVFDVKSWAAWATRYGVDPRGVAFVLTYPEMVTGNRTTPRSLVQFFDQIQDIVDLQANLDLVSTLAMSSLDDVTVGTFMSFVQEELKELLSSEEILESTDFTLIAKRIEKIAEGKDGSKRVDLLATICTRLYLTVTTEGYTLKKQHGDNLRDFISLKVLPNDLRLSLHSDFTKHGNESVKEVLRDKSLAKLLVEGI